METTAPLLSSAPPATCSPPPHAAPAERSEAGVAFFDAELRLQSANDALGDLLGRRLTVGPAGATPALPSLLQAAVARVAKTGVPAIDVETRTNRRRLLSTVCRVDGADGPLGVSVVTRVAPPRGALGRSLELRESHRRLSVLARTGELLERSLDLHETLPLVGGLVVDQVADACNIDVLGADRQLRRVVNIGSVGGRPTVAYPLWHGDRRVGTMTVVHRTTDARDAELLERLARRLAGAVANSQLYAERDHVARTLQNSLLPPALPRIAGFELAAAFRPAGAGNEVGGDFYDAFPVAPGTWALVLGDVCGKGADAAAITALARYSVRTITAHEHQPSAVLRELNDSLLRHGKEDRFCTVLFARVDETSGRVTVSSGGHPPPLLLSPHAGPRALDVTGTLLGVTAQPEVEDEDVCLEPGETLVFYTDGIMESSTGGGRQLGIEGLRDTVGAMTAAPVQEIADGLVGLARTAPGGQRDDAAALVLRAA